MWRKLELALMAAGTALTLAGALLLLLLAG